jgi:hypothetical protein
MLAIGHDVRPAVGQVRYCLNIRCPLLEFHILGGERRDGARPDRGARGRPAMVPAARTTEGWAVVKRTPSGTLRGHGRSASWRRAGVRPPRPLTPPRVTDPWGTPQRPVASGAATSQAGRTGGTRTVAGMVCRGLVGGAIPPAHRPTVIQSAPWLDDLPRLPSIGSPSSRSPSPLSLRTPPTPALASRAVSSSSVVEGALPTATRPGRPLLTRAARRCAELPAGPRT